MLLLAGGQQGRDEALLKLQLCLVRVGVLPLLLELVTSSTFLVGADLVTRKAAYLSLLRLIRFWVVGHSLLFTVVEAQLPTSNTKIIFLLSPLTSLLPPLSQGRCQTRPSSPVSNNAFKPGKPKLDQKMPGK